MRCHRLLTLFAAEEIPFAIVTFVSLLMFWQLGVKGGLAVFFSSLLFLPWVFKSFVRSLVQRVGRFKSMTHLSEVALCGALFALAASFSKGVAFVFAVLFIISVLCAWHELLARMYYEKMLSPRQQRLYNAPKIVVSHASIVFTYGALILLVGSMEVFYRQIRWAWAMGCYLTAGLFALFIVYHMFALASPEVSCSPCGHGMGSSLREEWRVIGRICGTEGWYRAVATLFFLLLPQSLMFYVRVLFFLDTADRGGLQCTIQEIGFAQGTVGVLAFCVGMGIGRSMLARMPEFRIFLPMAVTLSLSPVVYLVLAWCLPSSLLCLCIATTLSQLFFGIGICVCYRPVQVISGDRYRNTVNLLYVPLIAACMILPMALSGWISQTVGYRCYFLINAFAAPLAWYAAVRWKRSEVNRNFCCIQTSK